MLWNGNECGKNKSNENFKTTIPSNNYDSPKISIWVACYQMMEVVLVKINPGLPQQKLHSTRRGLFLLAHWI
jgi:hypothetical protein